MRDQTWAPGSAAVADFLLRPGGPALSAQARLVYLTLFSYMGTDGYSRPSIPTIAEGSSVSRRKTIAVLAELEAGGFLERRQTGRSTIYRLYPPWDPKPVDNIDSVVDKSDVGCEQRVDNNPETCGQPAKMVHGVHIRSAQDAHLDSGTNESCRSEVHAVHIRSAQGAHQKCTTCTPSNPVEETHLSNPMEKPTPSMMTMNTPATRCWSQVVDAVAGILPRGVEVALSLCKPQTLDQVALTVALPFDPRQSERIERNRSLLRDKLRTVSGQDLDLILVQHDARAGPEEGQPP